MRGDMTATIPSWKVSPDGSGTKLLHHFGIHHFGIYFFRFRLDTGNYGQELQDTHQTIVFVYLLFLRITKLGRKHLPYHLSLSLSRESSPRGLNKSAYLDYTHGGWNMTTLIRCSQCSARILLIAIYIHIYTHTFVAGQRWYHGNDSMLSIPGSHVAKRK